MTLISFIAYADDLFSINCHKSFTFSSAAFKKQSKVIFDYDSKFYVGALPLKALCFKDKFFYLGMYLIPNGKIFKPPLVDSNLFNFKSAPLKPQQKLFLLKNHLLPKYYHQLVLGKLYAGNLRKINLKVRRFVRVVLHLPNDIPSSAFHACVKDGEMKLPCIR